MQKDTAARFLRETFQPNDRMAIVLLNKQNGAVTQRIASAEQAASPRFQAWLRYQNSQRYEIYFTPNVLESEARGRTKTDIGEVRHVYLDFDENGTEKTRALVGRSDLPKPSYVVNSSPDRWQAFWKVQGFGKDDAEALMRHLVRELGADPAATDCSRVMRLPGFYNHKYAHRHYVRVEHLSSDTYSPEHFPKPPVDVRGQRSPADFSIRTAHTAGRISQSELDFAYAMRALLRGETAEAVTKAIAQYREGEKANEWEYAARTVRKVVEHLAPKASVVEPER